MDYNYTTDEIAKKIEDGSYFEEAKEWYAYKYILPITERSWMVLVCIIVALFFTHSAMNIQNLIQKDKDIPFTVRVDDSVDHFSNIQSLAQGDETAQESVARYLITDYIRTWEEYDAKSAGDEYFKLLSKKVRSSSSKDVLDDYRIYMNPANPYSPAIRYQDKISRSIAITSFTFLDSDKTSGKARVRFAATLKEANKSPVKSLWDATVHFRLPDVEAVAKTGAPLRFLVRYYKVEPVQ